MNTDAVELSIVVPAFDEERRLGATLDRLAEWCARRPGGAEIVVVDDGSTDRTGEVAAEPRDVAIRTVRLERNRGKGAAVRAGVAATRGELVLITDADLSTPIEELAKLERELGGAEIAIGSRALAGSRIVERQPLWRQTSGKLFNAAIRILGIRGISDTQCGFKLLRGDVARDLFARLTVDHFAFDVELLWLARRLGYRIREVGVEWRNDPASHVRLWRDGLRMLADVVRFRSRHRGVSR